MPEFPKIRTAIPQRRYRYGDYGVTILGDVDSGDERSYQFVAAFVKEGQAQPQLFVVSEILPPDQRAQGSHALRVVNSSMDEILETGARWGQLAAFTDQALTIGAQMLGLEQEQPFPL
jgi:hypothetical protein